MTYSEPPDIGDSQSVNYLGVPDNYLAFRDLPADYWNLTPETASDLGIYGSPAPLPSKYAVPPRYQSGAEYAPAAASPESILGLQSALEAGSWYTKGAKYRAGVWDEETILAYRKALITANASGLDIMEVLQRAAESEEGGSGSRGGGGGGAAPLLPNPEDIKALGNQAAQDLIGANLDPNQAEAFVQAFYAAYQPQGGYSPAAPDVIASNYIKETMPGEYGAHEQTRVFDVFADMLGGL